MTDAEYEAQKARLRKLIAYWPHVLGLRYWELSYEYVRSPHQLANPADEDAVAVARPDWRYLHAGIGFNLWRVAEQDDGQLEIIFVHELMHCLLDEVRRTKGARDNEERTAQVLALAWIWARDEGRRYDPVEGEY